METVKPYLDKHLHVPKEDFRALDDLFDNYFIPFIQFVTRPSDFGVAYLEKRVSSTLKICYPEISRIRYK